jgi:hypothetical protein
MPALLSSIRRHPVPAYCDLASAISWSGVLVAVGPGNIPSSAEHFERVLPLAIYLPVMLFS